jgi:hypothetical protein
LLDERVGGGRSDAAHVVGVPGDLDVACKHRRDVESVSEGRKKSLQPQTDVQGSILRPNLSERPEQGDQIGRIFAQWVVVFFGQLLKIYKNSPQFWSTFYQSKDDLFIFTEKMVWAIFTSSSGHPGPDATWVFRRSIKEEEESFVFTHFMLSGVQP